MLLLINSIFSLLKGREQIQKEKYILNLVIYDKTHMKKKKEKKIKCKKKSIDNDNCLA